MWNFGNCLVLLFLYNPYNQCNSFNIQNPVNTMFGGLWFENAMYFTNEKIFLFLEIMLWLMPLSIII